MKKINYFDHSFINVPFGSMKRTSTFFLITTGVLFFSACHNNDDNNNNTTATPQQVQTVSDKDFVSKAGLSNRAEIDLGELAMTKGKLDSVRAFGKLMVNEHTLAQNDLKNVASSKNMTVPDTLDAMHKALKQQLMNLSGHAFDSVYISSQVTDHQKTKQDFQTEINTGQDQDIKNYAVKYLPHIQMHLDKAIIIQDSVAKSKK